MIRLCKGQNSVLLSLLIENMQYKTHVCFSCVEHTNIDMLARYSNGHHS